MKALEYSGILLVFELQHLTSIVKRLTENIQLLKPDAASLPNTLLLKCLLLS